MKVTVIGGGYVGLVSAACFADAGNDVHVVEVDAGRVAALRQGRVPIYEPGLDELVARNGSAGRLHFTTAVADAVPRSPVVLLAVGTPPGADGAVDLSQAEAAVREVARTASEEAILVVKSTVPVGFHGLAAGWIAEETAARVHLVANPEFLKQGAAVQDFMSPDRVIVGSTDPAAIETMRVLYGPFMRRADRMIVMTPASAELTKYACNAMLATRISFMNELAGLCEAVGADISMVRHGLGSDPRIGPHFLYASLGYGGSCLPKDLAALVAMGESLGHPMPLARATRAVNAAQPDRFFRKILGYFGHALRGLRIAVWGLSFKAKTDGIRESAAIVLVERLLASGAHVVAHDPKAVPNARRHLGERAGLAFVDDPYQAVRGADGLVVCTEWPEYRALDTDVLRAVMARPVVFDGRNLYDVARMARAGIDHVSIGRRAALAPGR